MSENKDYIYIVDKNIEVLSKQITKLRRTSVRMKLGLLLTAFAGVYVADKLVKVAAIHIKEIEQLKNESRQLRNEIEVLKGDKE